MSKKPNLKGRIAQLIKDKTGNNPPQIVTK